MRTLYLSLAALVSGFTALAQQTPDVVANAGDDISNGTVTLSHTLGEIAVTDVSNGSVTLQQGFHNVAQRAGIAIEPVIILAGAYDDAIGQMRDDLRAQNLIPFTSPYADALTVPASAQMMFMEPGMDAVVDWVYVELRDSMMNGLVVEATSAVVLVDGRVVDAVTKQPLRFSLMSGTYFVSINHRNHLGAITDNAEFLANGTDLDFTDGTIAIEDRANGQAGQTVLTSGDFALFAGDANGDGQVAAIGAASDIDAIQQDVLNAPANFFNQIGFQITMTYSDSDTNLSGIVSAIGAGNDTAVVRNTILDAPENFFNQLGVTITQPFN